MAGADEVDTVVLCRSLLVGPKEAMNYPEVPDAVRDAQHYKHGKSNLPQKRKFLGSLKTSHRVSII